MSDELANLLFEDFLVVDEDLRNVELSELVFALEFLIDDLLLFLELVELSPLRVGVPLELRVFELPLCYY